MKTLLFTLLFAVCVLSVSATNQSPVPAFDYKVENGVSEGKLNSLSAEGWEVVTSGNYNGGMPYIILRRRR